MHGVSIPHPNHPDPLPPSRSRLPFAVPLSPLLRCRRYALLLRLDFPPFDRAPFQELLPKEQTNVIDLVGMLTKGQVKRINKVRGWPGFVHFAALKKTRSLSGNWFSVLC